VAGAVVLRVSDPDVRRCYVNALGARERARKAKAPLDREFYLEAEKRWLRLAESFEYSARLSRFLEQPRNLPTRPICFACDVAMWLKKTDCVGGQIGFRYECPVCEATEMVTQTIRQQSS